MIHPRPAVHLPFALAFLAAAASAQVELKLVRTDLLGVGASSPDGTWITGSLDRQPGGHAGPAFRWSEASGIECIATFQDFGRDITTDGQGVLSSFQDADGRSSAGVWTPTGLQLIGGLGGFGSANGFKVSEPAAMSDDGQRVAATGWLDVVAPPLSQRAFLWSSPGSVQVLDSPDGLLTRAWGISDDGGVVVGNDRSPYSVVSRPLRWEGGVPLVLAPEGTAFGTNGDGSFVTGHAQDRAFRWSRAGGLELLDQLPPRFAAWPEDSYGVEVSDDGEGVLGWQYIPFGMGGALFPRQFLWRSGAGAVEVRELLETLGADELAEMDLVRVSTLSPDGRTLVGVAWAEGIDRGNWIWVASLPPVAEVYCTSQTSSAGCTPAIGSTGTPSARTGAGFLVTASGVQANEPGTLVFGTSGSASVPFAGGVLCVQAPLHRVQVAPAGGSGPCDGVLEVDFNAHVASAGDPALVAGTKVWAQFWSRDPGAPPPHANLSDALAFTLWP